MFTSDLYFNLSCSDVLLNISVFLIQGTLAMVLNKLTLNALKRIAIYGGVIALGGAVFFTYKIQGGLLLN